VIFLHPPSLPARASARDPRLNLVSGLGGLLGIALVLALEVYHVQEGAALTGARDTFVNLALESAPALLLAYLAVALLHALRLDLPRLLGKGGEWAQALRGTLVGLPLPVCSCGVIPLYRSLIQQRVPVPAAMAFLVATPELSFPALFLSWSLLGGEITLARATSAVLLALLVGWGVGRRARVRADVPLVAPPAGEAAPGAAQRARSGLRYAFGDMLDGTAPWILLGLVCAALLEPLLRADELTRLPDWLEVPLFALAGMPLYVCASGSTPLVAVLLAKGASPGAAIAFLLTGPATNLTTFGVLSRLHGQRVGLAFAGAVAVLTTALGFAVNGLLPGASAVAPVHLHEHGASPLQLACALLLALAFAASLLRQGTRVFVGQVISPHGRAAEEPAHAHDDHGHGHGHHAHASCCEAEPTGAK
jgi:uncharacterized membrane protein YraQ (UPF0718 family)